jgi:nucleoside-diphosphate-sugar epimerase
MVAETARAGSRGGVFHIGSGEETKILDLAELVFSVSGHRPRLEHHAASPGSVRRRVPEVRKLTGLGFRPRIELAAGLRDCWDALRKRSTRA